MSVRRLVGVLAVATVALLVGALPAEAAGNYPPNNPTISISRTRVAVGGTAVVKATGCTPNSVATVTVTPSGQTYKPKANSAGIVTQQVRFTVLGTNTVTVSCGSTPSPLSVTVTVVASQAIWADATTINAGGKVTVSASGYAHNAPVTVTVTSSSGAAVLTTTATTNASGVASVTLPFTQAGTYSVKVLGLTITGAQLQQTITITVLGAVMPHTGADLVPFSLGGVALLLAGGALVVATRRRRSRPTSS